MPVSLLILASNISPRPLVRARAVTVWDPLILSTLVIEGLKERERVRGAVVVVKFSQRK